MRFTEWNGPEAKEYFYIPENCLAHVSWGLICECVSIISLLTVKLMLHLLAYAEYGNVPLYKHYSKDFFRIKGLFEMMNES